MSKANEFKKWFSERMGHSDPLKLAKEAIEELERERLAPENSLAEDDLCNLMIRIVSGLGMNVDDFDEGASQFACILNMANAAADKLEPTNKLINKSQIERDAQRYRFLRNANVDAINSGGIFAGKTPDNVVLNGVDLDDAIDAAMGDGRAR